MIRLIAAAIYAAGQQSKKMGLQNLVNPEPIIGKIFYFLFVPLFGAILLIAILCIISLLIGFNFFFYMMIELFLSVATTGDMNSWAWLAMGTPRILKNSQFQMMLNALRNMLGTANKPYDIFEYIPVIYLGFLFFYFSALVLMIKLPLSGPILVLVIKAFVEMYFFGSTKKRKGSQSRAW